MTFAVLSIEVKEGTVAHVETVQQVAARLGTETALKWADHRIEALEAEIRSNYQAMRALADAVLNNDPRTAELASAVAALMKVKQGR